MDRLIEAAAWIGASVSRLAPGVEPVVLLGAASALAALCALFAVLGWSRRRRSPRRLRDDPVAASVGPSSPTPAPAETGRPIQPPAPPEETAEQSEERQIAETLRRTLGALGREIGAARGSDDLAAFAQKLDLAAAVDAVAQATAADPAEALPAARRAFEVGTAAPILRAQRLLDAYGCPNPAFRRAAAEASAALRAALWRTGLTVLDHPVLAPVNPDAHGPAFTQRSDAARWSEIGFMRRALASIESGDAATAGLVVDVAGFGWRKADGAVQRPRLTLYNRLEWGG